MRFSSALFSRVITAYIIVCLFVALLSSGGRVDAQTTCTALPTDKGLATSDVSATSAGTYYVWARIMAPDSTNNSVFVQVNNTLCNVNMGDSSIPANTWTWVGYRDNNAASRVSTNLVSGTNKLYVAGRENGVKVDKVIFTANSSCTPTGFGENCTTNQPDTTKPSTPANLTSSGVTQTSLNLNWTASTDDKAVTGYEIYRNGTKLATNATTNSYTNTGLTAGTTYSYYVVAYDAAGNKSTPSNTIQVTTTQATSTKIGDLNNDTKIDVLDLSFMLSNWDPTGSKPKTAADINNDNKVDVLDLSALLSNWGK
jgi:hypothetical protein